MMAAQGITTTAGEVMEASYDNFLYNDRSVSSRYAQMEAATKLFDPHIAAFEKRDPTFDRRDIYQKSKRYFNEPSEALGGRLAYTPDEAKYAYLKEVAAQQGETDLPSFDDFMTQAHQMGAADATAVAAKADEVAAMYGGQSTAKVRLAQFAAGIGAMAQDPVVVGAIIASWPMAASASIVRMAGIEAAISAASEVPIQFARRNWYEEQGRDLSLDEMAMAVGIATVFGGAVGGAVGGGYKLFGGTNTQMFSAFKYGPADYLNDIARANADARVVSPRQSDIAYFLKHEPRAPEPEPVWEGPSVSSEWTDSVTTAWQYPAFKHESLDHGLTEASTGVVDPELRATMISTAADANLRYTSNPAFTTDRLAASYTDRVVWTHNNRVLMDRHRANMQESIEALNRGVMPSPKGIGELSLRINLADTASDASRAHMRGEASRDVDKVLSSKTPPTMRSATVRRTVINMLRKAYDQKVTPHINRVAHKFPESGAFKPDFPRPKRSRAAVDKAVAKADARVGEFDLKIRDARKVLSAVARKEKARVATKIKHLQKGVEEARKLGDEWAAAQRNPDLEPPEIPEGFRSAKEIEADIQTLRSQPGPEVVKQQKVIEQLTEQRAKAAERMAEHEKSYAELDAWAAKVLEAESVNEGLRMLRNLELLANGKVPKELEPLRDLVLKSLDEARTLPKGPETWLAPDAPNWLSLTAGDTYKSMKKYAKETDQRWASADAPAVAKELAERDEALFKQATPEMKAAVDYEEVEIMEQAIEALKTCRMAPE
jgi:hypothetical protein